ncbi:MAG TPA: hypothetical protein VF207_01230, partial [Chthoniobacterales bacterium]
SFVKFFETANRCAVCPEGAGGLSPGVLTPGRTPPKKPVALKGRQITIRARSFRDSLQHLCLRNRRIFA